MLSNISIGQTIRFAQNEKEYIFLPDDDGILSKIKIIKTIHNADKFYSKIAKTSPIAITFNEDPAVREEMISDFQYLEAHIGFITQLAKIFWNEPLIEWIPETEDERNKLEVFSAQFRRETSFPPTKLSIKFFRNNRK